jgi:hypothetical protein
LSTVITRSSRIACRSSAARTRSFRKSANSRTLQLLGAYFDVGTGDLKFYDSDRGGFAHVTGEVLQ